MADQNYKFLAIKNWSKYQPKNKTDYPWIRDYKEKDFDPDISKLTVFQRGLLDMCCRLRGRMTKNLSNDPLWIVGAVSIMPQERRNAVSGIGQLIVKGFLIPTNQQDTPLEEESTYVSKGKEEPQPTVRKAHGNSKKPEEVLPVDSRHIRIKSLICNAYFDQTGLDCPWGPAEGSQLKRFLNENPTWLDSQIAQCLVNMYASSGFPKGTRPSSFLPRLTQYVKGPLNEYNREKTSERGNSKVEQRNAGNREAIIQGITGVRAGGGLVHDRPAISNGNNARDECIVDIPADRAREIIRPTDT